jgi:hypothetical protein
MDESAWNACTEATPLLEFLRASGRASDRKFRLFACGCCRRIWDRLPDPCNRDLVAAVEDHPDGAFGDPGLHEALIASSRREYEFSDQPAYWAVKYLGRGFYKLRAFDSAVVVALKVLSAVEGEGRRKAEVKGQAALLRDLFGPLPFRPVPVDAAWLTWNDGTVRRLAEAAYQERQLPAGTLDPARLGVLADALEEAGCTDPDLLGHLRGPGPHVRGCWPVDLLTGRQ